MNNIATILAGLRGVSFVGLDIETIVDLQGGKKNEMRGRVTKRARGTVLIAQNKGTNTYQNMVRKAIVGELLADFTAKLEKADEAQTLLTDVLSPAEMEALAAKIESALSETDEDRKAAAEERFTVSERKWGSRIPNTPFIETVKKGETTTSYYLDTIWLHAGKSEYFLDGQPIAKDKIVGLKTPVAKEGANVQGGLKVENQVIVRSLGLDSIKNIRTSGQEFNGPFYYS